jgi:hypothetical protein
MLHQIVDGEHSAGASDDPTAKTQKSTAKKRLASWIVFRLSLHTQHCISRP